MKTDKHRSRLGRGLSSLIVGSTEETSLPIMREIGNESLSQSSDSAGSRSVVLEIPVRSIRPNPHQPRRQINSESIAELAMSIRNTGIIQPILVRTVDDGYELIAGERRWRATQLAELSTIPAIVREASPASQAEMALIENIQREDLNPIDRATSYRTLMDQLAITQAELADRLGEERSGIANYLRLLNLTEPVREQVRNGELSLGHAKLLASVEDILQQTALADNVVKNDLSVRNLERIIQNAPARPASQKTSPSAHLRDLETTLMAQLQMRVNVQTVGKKGGGRVTIHYTSLDQFDDLVRKLGVNLSET